MRAGHGECIIRRIYRIGNALLSLKEQEYLPSRFLKARHEHHHRPPYHHSASGGFRKT